MSWGVVPYYEITIRQFDITERTGNVTHLLRWWNILPSRLFVRSIARQLSELAKQINDTDKGDEFMYQVEALLKIEVIRVNYLGIVNILANQKSANFFVRFIKGTRHRRIREINSPNLARYIAEVKRTTGIDINTVDDLKRVKQTLQFRIDKYNEAYMQKLKKEEGKTYLMSIALGVFSYLNMPFNPQITVIEFIEARKKAEEMYQRQRAEQLKHQN